MHINNFLAATPSPVGERALLEVLLLTPPAPLPATFVLGEACLTSVCLNGSDLTPVDTPQTPTPALVGVVSHDNLPLPVAGFVVVRATLLVVATVTLRLLGSILVSALVCRHMSEFLLAMAVCVLLPNTAVVRPTSMPLRDVLVQECVIIACGHGNRANPCLMY